MHACHHALQPFFCVPGHSAQTAANVSGNILHKFSNGAILLASRTKYKGGNANFLYELILFDNSIDVKIDSFQELLSTELERLTQEKEVNFFNGYLWG